jgi:hypothetical protein
MRALLPPQMPSLPSQVFRQNGKLPLPLRPQRRPPLRQLRLTSRPVLRLLCPLRQGIDVTLIDSATLRVARFEPGQRKRCCSDCSDRSAS